MINGRSNCVTSSAIFDELAKRIQWRCYYVYVGNDACNRVEIGRTGYATTAAGVEGGA
jgi:hypothetical protein